MRAWQQPAKDGGGAATLVTLPCPGAKEILSLVGDISWEDQVRSYVAGQGQCTGLLGADKGDELRPTIQKISEDKAKLTKLVNRHLSEWCKEYAPPGYGWTSLQINVDTCADWHTITGTSDPQS